jgi:hypothetical protein
MYVRYVDWDLRHPETEDPHSHRLPKTIKDYQRLLGPGKALEDATSEYVRLSDWKRTQQETWKSKPESNLNPKYPEMKPNET